nr:tyrosine-protein phosphatase 10D-like isoform X1 [Onthophagus taurus]
MKIIHFIISILFCGLPISNFLSVYSLSFYTCALPPDGSSDRTLVVVVVAFKTVRGVYESSVEMFKTRRFRIDFEVFVFIFAILCVRFYSCATDIATTETVPYTDTTQESSQFETRTTQFFSTNSDYEQDFVTESSTDVETFSLSGNARDFVTDTFSRGITQDESTTVFTTEEITIQSPCQTVPDELKDIKITNNANIYNLSWGKPTNQECNKYKISINGVEEKIIETNSIEIENTSRLECTKIEISAVDVENNVGNAATRLIPGEISNLEATPKIYEIELSWDAPSDGECVDMYYIYLNDEKYKETTITTEVLTDVEACTTHNIRVTTVSKTDGDIVESEGVSIKAKTGKPSTASSVENLRLTSEATTLSATWDPPKNTGACIYRYTIRLMGSQSTIDKYTENTFINIEPVTPCEDYSFMIYPQLSEAINGLDITQTTSIKEYVTPLPDIKNYETEKTNITFSVKLVDYTSNKCKISSINATCIFSGDNYEPWMVKESSSSIEYTDSTTRPIQDIVVDELSPYTNYSCDIFVVNSAGASEPANLGVETNEDVPSKPENLNTKSDENKIYITWDKPSKIPGILQDYKLAIKYEETKHFIPNYCEINKEDVVSLVNENNYLFESFVPNSIYSLTIQAQTGAGFGEEASIDFETEPKISNKVINLDKNVTINNDEVYDVSIKIVWKLPCTNGNLIKFNYIIEGVKLENEEPLKSIVEEIQPNENIKDENYYFEMSAEPWVKYTVTVYAVTKGIEINNELDGEFDSIEIISPEGRPSPPQSITVTEITSTNAQISWEEPNNKNGIITNYQINIDSIRPLHEVNDFDCESKYSFSDEVNETFNYYDYNDFKPNYEYKVAVRAKTESGYGEANETIHITSTAPSESVRLILYYFIIKESEDYDVNLGVVFKEPCHLNGKLSSYKLTIQGTRSGFPDVSVTDELTEYTEKGFILPLKPEYTYEGFIEVYTEENFVSEKNYLDGFTSSAGIPKDEFSQISDPHSIESESIKFDLNQDTFSNEMGEIIYYAIILAPEDYNPLTNYGITNGSWPDTGSWSQDEELKEYQTTPKEWNPFKSGKIRSSNSVYTVSIGTENCEDSQEEYCNGKLRPDTSYSLRVRGFTSYGYRDTPKITFYTPSKLNYGALIGGIVGAAAALIIIFIIIIVWRRRRTKSQEEETALDTLPLVPQPVPINKFLDHYDDYKNNLNKLKAEYSLLERLGISEQLPMTFAMTDDNKRKNRYINILPYDETRVKLDRDKNDNYADYINASFIKGYSGNVEYIATQGPLESTIVDFWRMVIQENVAVIVMVAQFVEHEKAKCHQYFPNNHETMAIGDGIEIKCANEVPLGSYIKRTLMVQRELMQITITHLQYIQWPDFGCPNDADSMLDFCNILRQCVEQYKSKTIIHCSAGVGRTGTLIALDILLQTIENAGDIDIFKTVLNLRKQRVRMVQTEKQYMYIHNCLAEYITNPKKGETKETEPIYENITKKNDDEISIKVIKDID